MVVVAVCCRTRFVALIRTICRGLSDVHRMSSLNPLVFSGPSGSGKSTLVQRLMKEYSGCFAFSVSRKLLAIRTKCH